MPPAIVLLTDFGTSDPFVGVMKGVVLSRCPGAPVIDLTHHVAPQDIRAGAFSLMTSYSYFPKGSIFVAVVDPGVGSERSILFARTRDHQFLAPDNGLLSWVERKEPFIELRQVSNRKLFLSEVSHTFHGRDIFAPVAGELAGGLRTEGLGPIAASMTRIPFPEPKRSKNKTAGLVLSVDRFGNCITNLTAEAAAAVSYKGKRLGAVKTHYAAVQDGRPLAVAGSSGFIELCVRKDSFAKKYNAKIGDPVDLIL